MSTSPRQLLLLADHLKLSLLERQRAIALNLEPSKQDGQISRSLVSLQEGIQELESQQAYTDELDENTELANIRRQYTDLYAQFHGSAPPTRGAQEPNDPALAGDFAAAQSKLDESRRSKNVRFRDNPNDASDDANRAALFAEQSRYRDKDPAATAPALDQSQLDNQQIHAYHTQVLREQDEQLETLGQSIGRQRMLGIQMGSELEEQAELLDDVDRGVDRHSNTLDRARQRLGTFARKSKENWSWITIAILVIILILIIKIL